MFRSVLQFVVVLSLLFLFSGCVESGVSPYPEHTIDDNNTWGEMTNVDDEDVDITDLDENITEDELNITEAPMDTRVARIPFPVSEYRRLASSGKGTISGTIYLTNLYGQRVPGRGTRLYLNPVTSYSEQWYQESYLGGAKMQKADPRLFNYLRFTASDSEGNFAFYGVPSGRYYLIGTVKCGTECGYDTTKNIRIATVVSISGNRVVHKDLSKSVE